MRIWHDWEFLEDGTTIKPISVGMVTEDGHELYYEFHNVPWADIAKHEWLMENVVPGLRDNGANGIKRSKLVIRNKVVKFLMDSISRDSGKPLELWGWYSAYDHVCLAQLFGRMIDLPDWCPMLTMDLKQEFIMRGVSRHPNIPRQATGLHNALEDAKHLRTKHLWLDNLVKSARLDNISGLQVGNGNVQNNSY